MGMVLWLQNVYQHRIKMSEKHVGIDVRPEGPGNRLAAQHLH